MFAEAVKMLSPLETGTTLGATPGTWEEPGNLVPRTDAWHRRTACGASKARQLAGLARRCRCMAPHLIHGGPCLILPGRNVFFQDRHAGNRRNASRDDPGHGREHRRGLHAAAPRPEAAGAEAAVVGGQTQGGSEHPRPGFSRDLVGARPEPRVRPAGCVTAGTGTLIG
jgi:hypothetical protein